MRARDAVLAVTRGSMRGIVRLTFLALCLAGCATEFDSSDEAIGSSANLTFTPVGRFDHGSFGETAAEVAAYHADSRRLLVVNGELEAIDVLDLSDPTAPVLGGRVDISPYGGAVTSVAIHAGLAAAAVPAAVKTDPGSVVFFDVESLEVRAVVEVGAVPDMVTYSPDGAYAIVANEGEPNDDYTVDPEGSVTVIRMRWGGPDEVRTARFTAFDAAPPNGVRLKAGVRASVDLEPEYVTVSDSSRTAYVTLQENNAMAVIDLRTATVMRLLPLGAQDHSMEGRGLDPSNRDSAIQIASWPVRGLYMPDAIDAFSIWDRTYLAMANEGDGREWGDYVDEARISSLALDQTAFPDAAAIQAPAALGRLNVLTTEGDEDGDGDYDALYSLGARSFSIRDTSGRIVWDSADELEQLVASLHPANFNANDDENGLDGRSDDRGPEPEAIAVARLWGRHFAFVGLERISAIAVYDVERPWSPRFVEYVSTRDFGVEPGEETDAGDLAPEGIVVVSRDDSPTGRPLLIATYETSGTTRIFEISCGE
jgi:hypothetical protein